EVREFVYEVKFADKTNDDKEFVEDLWARRKVGYLLDQIRANGEKKELIDEVMTLAKRYGITTPYTSYLVVPDTAMPVVRGPGQSKAEPGFTAPAPVAPPGPNVPPALTGAKGTGRDPGGPVGAPLKVEDFAKKQQEKPGDLAGSRGKFEEGRFSKLPPKEATAGADKPQPNNAQAKGGAKAKSGGGQAKDGDGRSKNEG